MIPTQSRNSCPEMFCKKGVLQKRTSGTGASCELLKFLRTPILQNNSGGCSDNLIKD